ncbi:unnamed protein product, partial [Callosobruchus maculatus]
FSYLNCKEGGYQRFAVPARWGHGTHRQSIHGCSSPPVSKSFNLEVWWHFMTSSVSRLINLANPRMLDAEKEAIRHGISQKSTDMLETVESNFRDRLHHMPDVIFALRY